jgi:polar amino acid transport system substrate-binding protein
LRTPTFSVYGRHLLAAVALLLSVTALTARAQPLRLLSEEFAPITFSQDGVPRGLAVEVVQEIQRRLGDKSPIEFMPWTRAYRELQGNSPVALFTTARTPARERLFKWVGPVVTFYSAFYALPKSPRQVTTLEEAQRAEAVLVVRDWFTAEELTVRGFRNLVMVNDPQVAVRMLMAGRAPLFASERLAMPQMLGQAGLAEDALEVVFSYASSQGYIAFSQATPEAVVRQWATQLAEMKRDGSFATIYKRWLPKDPPPVRP